MDFSRTLSGGDSPFVTNMPVYLATTAQGLKKGAVLCTGATGTNAGYTLSVTTTTAACADAIGVLQIGAYEAYNDPDKGQSRDDDAGSYRVQSDYICDRTQSVGADWLPTIVNPDALYMGWLSHTTAAATASDTLTESITASTGTIVTITSVLQDVIGGWIFTHSINSTTTTTYSGSLRYANKSIADSSIGCATAVNMSTDSSVLFCSRPGITQTVISSTGQFLRSGGAGGAGKAEQKLLTHDNYIGHDAAPMHPLRFWVDDALDGLTGVKMYSEIALIDHYYYGHL